MASRRPLVVLNGMRAEMPAGDTLPLVVGGTGASTVSGALANLGLNTTGAVSSRNRLINGNFAVNQRGAASASTGYTAGTYTVDRWKAGSGGATVQFNTAGNFDVYPTVTAGTLCQVIEGTLYLSEGGSYVLSWSGTATARVYQGSATGSYAASPIAVTGLTGGTSATVEFSTGQFSLVQFEPGGVATLFERRDDELRRCLRYYFQAVSGSTSLFTMYVRSASAEPYRVGYFPFPVPMYATPTLTLVAYDESASANITCSPVNQTRFGTGLFAQGGSNTAVVDLRSVVASAEL